MRIADRLIVRNALLGRYAYPQLRPAARTIAISIYLVVVAVAGSLVLAAACTVGKMDMHEFWRNLFIVFAVLQVVLLWVTGAHLAGTTIGREVAEKSIDFFRLLPVSAAGRIVAILVGRNIVVLFVALLNTLGAAACGLLAGVSLRLLVDFLIFSWIGGAAAMLAATLISTYSRRGRLSTGGGGVVIIASVFMLPYGIGLAANWHRTFPHGAHVTFFGAQVDLFTFLSFLALYVGCWLVAGLIRRFNDERSTLFTSRGAFGYLAGAAAIMVGVLWNGLGGDAAHSLLSFWAVTAMVLLLVMFGACRTWDDYLETRELSGVNPGLRGANRSNLVTGTGLILFWGVLAALAEIRFGAVIPLRAVITLMVDWCVLLGLWEVSVTNAPLTGRIHMLTGLVAMLFLILPLILAAILDADTILTFSPVGCMSLFADKSKVPGWQPLAFGSVLAVLMAFLVGRRYRALARTPR
jgi:hypothetical protein